MFSSHDPHSVIVFFSLEAIGTAVLKPDRFVVLQQIFME